VINLKVRKNISLEDNVFISGNSKAKQMGFTFSAYITYLINKDLNGAIEIVEKKHEVIKNSKVSSAIDSILG
jgi:macrodomain Ter protein organizer (MatP/YcbG family)